MKVRIKHVTVGMNVQRNHDVQAYYDRNYG